MPDPTLRQFFDHHFLPECLLATGAAPRNVDQYRESMALACRQGLGELPLAAIDRAACTQFILWLRQRPGRNGTISASTVNKHLTAIGKILRTAGPADDRNPLGYDLLERPPRLAKLRTTTELREDLSLAEIEQWWDVVETARRPRIPGVAPADWWRAWLLLSYNTALRISTTLQVDWRHLKGEWLHLPGEIMKGGRAAKVYLNTAGRRAIERVRTDSDRVLSWPYRIRSFHTVRRSGGEIAARPQAERHRPAALRPAADRQAAPRRGPAAKAGRGLARRRRSPVAVVLVTFANFMPVNRKRSGRC